ncbi:PAS domain S-box protein [Spizellomyces punctatus DAOM BR117]|uniref:histidine kinase n=1 Tax=Spizellomyces punctatus (strain DAOM BR117) TaxID=645134 RepID=A0A0L0HV44_SPIPD|nr:PAS domain S-box protein [Spizellomyces punctatus DAOM BR117]KND04770.1 PAS domain S-box protein [Spizellomyces punctatus DAOM BR117]|eukprot:XP_016612809.1 PAS domain S-box protein [Spizellomyces punctatus DAOM BR117]
MAASVVGNADISSDLYLADYLDVLPQPYIIITYSDAETHPIFNYANPAFYDLLQPSSSRLSRQDLSGVPALNLLPGNYTSTLKDLRTAACSMTVKTGVAKNFEIISTDAIDRIQAQAIKLEIEWVATCIKERYFVLSAQAIEHRETEEPVQPETKVSKDYLTTQAQTSASDNTIRDEDTANYPRVHSSSSVNLTDNQGRLDPGSGIDSTESNDLWKTIPRFADSLAGGGIMGEMLRNFDWSNTPLGRISSWPQSLLTAVSLTMCSMFPMAIWWGPQFVLIYNDAYKPIAGSKHPWLFGKAGSEAWSEIWDTLEPMAQSVMQGERCYSEDHLLFMVRNGYPEETYHTWSYVPIRQEDGSVGGLLNPTFEATGRVVAERRLKTLREFGARTATAKSVPEVCSIAADVMNDSHHDITFAFIYTCSVDNTGCQPKMQQANSRTGNIKLHKLKLISAVGVEHGCSASPDNVTIDLLGDPPEDEIWPFHEACAKKAVVEVYDQQLIGGIEGRGWGEKSRITVVCPITANDGDDILGVLVAGLSARRPYDEDYRTFMELLCRQTATSIATVRAYEEEYQRAEALAMIDRAKTAFFSSVSHELRTPLTLILGPVDDLLGERSQPLNKRQLDLVHLINRNAQRLLKLVNSLLDFSRIEAGRMQATFKETDLVTFTADLASLFRSAIEKGGVQYIVDCELDGRTVWVDRDMWEKIVLNLIGNAFKFTLQGSIKVSLHPNEDKSGVIFAVEDTGTGIPSHEISRIFERFHRVDGQKGRSHEGSGIGLALTQELVRLHGGTVELRSVYGQGSTFSVFLPYGTSHLPQDRLSETNEDVSDYIIESKRSYGYAMVEEAKRWLSLSDDDTAEHSSTADSTESSVPSNTVPSTTRGSKVLLADDNSDMRRYVKTLLSKWWVVTDVADGQQALDAIKQEMPDIIVSDVMMPVLDGYGLLKVIRSLPESKMLPVILLSARAGEEARVDGLQLGADDYLEKPFSAKELVARVHTHLELGKLRVELERRVNERTRELAESEWRYKVLASLSPVGIFRSDMKGQITYANDKWWEISMHDREKDPAAVNFIESIHPEDRKRCQLHWQDAMNGRQCNIEFRWKNTRTGVERWCLGATMIEYDEAGNPVGHIGTCTDVTERKRLEKERLDVLEMAEKYQRRRAEEAEAVKKQQELFIDMTCHELRNPLNGIYHNADLLHESLEKVQKEVDGLHKTVESVEDIKLPASAPVTNSPVTRQTSKPKDNMIQSVKKVTRWLGAEVINDLEAVETITLCAQHQKQIADDVLHMSKISMNLLVLAQLEFQPRVEITKVLRMFDTEVKLKNIDLQYNIGTGYEALSVDWVRGDPTRLAQIMINILTNAIRFTEKAEVKKVVVTLDASETPPSLPNQPSSKGAAWDGMVSSGSEDDEKADMQSLSSSRSTSSSATIRNVQVPAAPVPSSSPATSANAIYVQVTIADSGLGMTPEEQAMLFRRFAQASPKTYADFGGSGLGLFISKRLVELQGGNIGVDSIKGQGTTFTFFVKYETVERRAESDIGVEGATGSRQPSQPPAAQSRWTSRLPAQTPENNPAEMVDGEVKISILIVEDNMVNQKVLKRQLETLGYSTQVANHGAEAIDILQRQERAFDIILMDIEMPVMDGLQATVKIREIYGNRWRIPIVAVTGNARREHLDKALQAGMDDVMVKPYVKKDLVEKIEMLVQRRRADMRR